MVSFYVGSHRIIKLAALEASMAMGDPEGAQTNLEQDVEDLNQPCLDNRQTQSDVVERHDCCHLIAGRPLCCLTDALEVVRLQKAMSCPSVILRYI